MARAQLGIGSPPAVPSVRMRYASRVICHDIRAQVDERIRELADELGARILARGLAC